MKNCCNINNKTKKCRRNKDKKIFSLPRRFSKKKCLTKKIKGFTMKSSCAPFKFCKIKKQKGGNISDCINSEDPITYEEIKDIPVDDLIKFKLMETTEENKGKINNCYDRKSMEEHIKSKIKQGKIPDLIRDPLSNKILGMEFILNNFPDALETEFNITTPSGDDYVYDEEEEEILDIDGELEIIKEEIENINNEEDDNTSAELIEEFSDHLHGLIQEIPENLRDDFISSLYDLVEDNIISPNKKIQLETIIKNEENDLIGGNKKKQYGKGPGMSVPANIDPIDPIEPYSILVITTHGGYSDFDDIEINSNIDFTKINAVKPGVCNYLDGENADAIVRFLENEKYYNTYSYESSVELLPSIMKILDPYAADPDSEDDKRFILTKINEINKTGKINRDLLEYNYNLLRNGSYIKYSAPKGSQYVDKDFEVFSSEKKKENQYLYFNGIILINKDGVEDILPLMTRRITRQTKKTIQFI